MAAVEHRETGGSPTRPDAAPGRELLSRVLAASAFTKALKPKRGKKRTLLAQVQVPAQAFAAALVLEHAGDEARRVWIIASDLRAQENLSHDLGTWWGETIFLPELEQQNIEEGSLPDEETQAERLALLQRLARRPDKMEVIVMNAASLDEMVPAPKELDAAAIVLKTGQALSLEKFAEQLENAGFERVPQAAERGQFAVRGGIIDLYPWQADLPLRVELFDTEIESLRQYDPDSQSSVARLAEATILLTAGNPGDAEMVLLRECIAKEDLVIAVELEESDRADVWITAGDGPDIGEGVSDFATACHENPLGAFEAGDFVLQQARRAAFADQLARWHAGGWRTVMFFNTEGEIERFRELLAEEAIEAAWLETRLGQVNHAFTVPAAKLAVLSDAELFGRYQHARARRLVTRARRQRARRAPLDLSDIRDGDYVVHLDHGIGRYRGLIQKAGLSGIEEDVVVIEYADQARLYLPLQNAWQVSKYIGVGKKTPTLDSLGSSRWKETKKKAERSIFEYAEKMLAMQAERQTGKGFAHPPDTKWQWEFENSFVHKETVDQLKAIEETKQDMEHEKPMDRLICGDVGFGKTEVAIRAAFKAVMGGKQVAFLAPTTVLSQQHWNNLRERMSDYPIRIELLNRFRTAKECREVLTDLAKGDVDIVVGTHRLISKDVSYKNLGLVIIDEEQRFGVKHKDRFKELWNLIDVLTLSATPIPRTLYMALMGVRDMTTIDTPPANKTPVETVICGYDERVIKKALERELKRKGQVFFLHNRVGSIEMMAEKLRKLSPPGTVIDIGHGQMPDEQLEDVMHRFVAGDTDILVCTTIIESGIDIPNANTIIIDRADRFGLADLYQLRGRVGRAGHKAYAYLMIPRSEMTGGDAKKRISAMKQYTELGSGFKIAMRDLEIRGAGNLLGTQQSGHIVAVGFDLYCQMLKASVNRISGKRSTGRIEVVLSLDFVALSEAAWLDEPEKRLPAFIPQSFIAEAPQRIAAYRQIAEVVTQKELAELIRHWRDRYGVFPAAVENLLRCTELKLNAHRAGVSAVEVKDQKLMLTRKGEYIQIGGKFPRLDARKPLEDQLAEAVTLVRQM